MEKHWSWILKLSRTLFKIRLLSTWWRIRTVIVKWPKTLRAILLTLQTATMASRLTSRRWVGTITRTSIESQVRLTRNVQDKVKTPRPTTLDRCRQTQMIKFHLFWTKIRAKLTECWWQVAWAASQKTLWSANLLPSWNKESSVTSLTSLTNVSSVTLHSWSKANRSMPIKSSWLLAQLISRPCLPMTFQNVRCALSTSTTLPFLMISWSSFFATSTLTTSKLSQSTFMISFR